MIFALLVVTIIGNAEPIFTFKPSMAYDTLERCEEQLISDLSEGDRISTYDYFSQNRRMISSQTRFKKTFATCVEASVPQPLMNEIGNNVAPMPLDFIPSKNRPRSRPENLATSAALNAALNSSGPVRDGVEPLALKNILGMREAINKCWNVGALSKSAMATSVIVEMELTLDGKPVGNSIKMLGFEGGDEISAERAFESARRAIIRCGAQGFELPKDQYDTWRRMNLTFDLRSFLPRLR